MRRPEATLPGSGSLRAVWLVLLCTAVSCMQPARVASFRPGQEISCGPIRVSVNGWEEVGESHAPLSSLRAASGEKAIAVFVGWNGLDPYSEPDRQVFAGEFLNRSLKLVDSDAFVYKAVASMPREIYRFSELPASAPRDWVVIFHAYVDSSGYTLQVSHPDPGEEAFDVASIPLG